MVDEINRAWLREFASVDADSRDPDAGPANLGQPGSYSGARFNGVNADRIRDIYLLAGGNDP